MGSSPTAASPVSLLHGSYIEHTAHDFHLISGGRNLKKYMSNSPTVGGRAGGPCQKTDF
jgi:hypothetical protein